MVIALRQVVKFRTTLQSLQDAVCTRLAFLRRLAHSRYHTVAYRVSCLQLVNQFKRIDRIILRVVINRLHAAYAHRIQGRSNVRRRTESVLAHSQRRVGEDGLARIDNRCGIAAGLQFLAHLVHLFRQVCLIFLAGLNSDVKHLKINALRRVDELLLILLVSRLQILIRHLHVFIAHRRIRHGSHFDIGQHITSVEIHLRRNRVGDKGLTQQGVEFHLQQLVAQLSFRVLPNLAKHLVLLHISLLAALGQLRHIFVVIFQEVLQCIHVKASCLLISKAHLRHHLQALRLPRAQSVLHILVSHLDAGFIRLVLDGTCVDKVGPHLFANLILFLISQRITLSGALLLHFRNVRKLLNAILEILNRQCLAKGFANFLFVSVGEAGNRLKATLGNKSKQTKTDDDHQDLAFASDFL